MRYWLDTEFLEDGRTIDLLSIGVVAEDGRELYLETGLARDFVTDPAKCSNSWVRENVVPHLRGDWSTVFGRDTLRAFMVYFCDIEKYGKPEFWGYYADYDWVALCQIFGRMLDLPKGWPMYCRDIKQLADESGNPDLPKQQSAEHHALADARWNREAWEFLQRVREGK